MQRRALGQIWQSTIFWQRHYFASEAEDIQYVDVPKPCRRKSERKPYPTPMKVLIRRAKDERKARRAELCRMLEAPENGLLIPKLAEMACRVNQARESLLHSLSKLVGVVVPVKRCRFCSEVHIGHVGHEIRTCTGPKSGFRGATHVWKKGSIEDVVYFPYCYHLYDRVGSPRVSHKDRLQVPRLPAILELCIQAGVGHEDYPTRRRRKPAYWIDGRIVDFEEEMGEADSKKNCLSDDSPSPDSVCSDSRNNVSCQNSGEKPSELGAKTLESWFLMRSGAEEIMKTYAVTTCGYCPEVQVGPKGHKVRWCRATKHQSRQGQHAWQEAIIDDLIGSNYVWHVQDPYGPPLVNELKRYYGKAPAVVELCVQAGAPVPREFQSMMRLDVIPPDRDEVDLVA